MIIFLSQPMYPPMNYLPTEDGCIVINKARPKNRIWPACRCFSSSHLFVRRH